MFIDKALVFLIFSSKMLRIFLFLTALDSAEGNWNTIMTSTVVPSSSGLWHRIERYLFKEYIQYYPTLFFFCILFPWIMPQLKVSAADYLTLLLIYVTLTQDCFTYSLFMFSFCCKWILPLIWRLAIAFV